MNKKLTGVITACALPVVALGVAASAAASPAADNGHNGQGFDVSAYAPTHRPFGEVVSGFAGSDGPLRGFVLNRANDGNNNANPTP